MWNSAPPHEGGCVPCCLRTEEHLFFFISPSPLLMSYDCFSLRSGFMISLQYTLDTFYLNHKHHSDWVVQRNLWFLSNLAFFKMCCILVSYVEGGGQRERVKRPKHMPSPNSEVCFRDGATHDKNKRVGSCSRVTSHDSIVAAYCGGAHRRLSLSLSCRHPSPRAPPSR